MGRPALSASRTTEVMDLLTAYPDRAFTMAEIVRETGINIASCHAVLAALTKSGYLTRLGAEKRYIMGPALVTAGQVALQCHPLIGRAQLAAKSLAAELEVPVQLATMIGDDILALLSIPDGSGRTVGMKTGQRRPVVPFACLVFVAWSSAATIEAWVRERGGKDRALTEQLRQAVANVHKRGYQVTLLQTDDYRLNELVAGMAADHTQIDNHKNRSMGLIGSQGQKLAQSAEIVADQDYDVALIAAPIFDQQESASLALCIGGFSARLSGAKIEKYGEHLVNVCVNVMRNQRSV